MDFNYQKSYSKNNLWKWVLIYGVAGVAAYSLVYYFFFVRNGGYSYNSQQYGQSENVAITNDQDLVNVSYSLDAVDLNQMDSGLNQNDADASAF